MAVATQYQDQFKNTTDQFNNTTDQFKKPKYQLLKRSI